MTAAQRRTITRNREMLACTECRRKKLKCDRNAPCHTCVKRGDGAVCKYQRYAGGLGNERERRIEAEARLEHLEQLVQQLAQPKTTPGGPNTHGNGTLQPTVPRGNGNVQTNGAFEENTTGDLAYNGSTHWSAMLEDIEELRFAMATSDTTNGLGDVLEEDTGVHLIFGSGTYVKGVSLALGVICLPPLLAIYFVWYALSELEMFAKTSAVLIVGLSLSLQQVLAQYLPSRQEADRLTAAYFRSRAVAAPFIHAPQFQRHYQIFWRDPHDAPPLWTSMFFSICHIATFLLTSHKNNSAKAGHFSRAAAHCLAIGRYFGPKRLSVESLLLFAQAQCLTGLDLPPDVGTIFGLVIRLASRMGYHRDPENLSISPFEKEMRLRTWSLCIQLDLLISFQLGLPSNIQFPTWDTRPPRNLLDADFDEGTETMPPSRPASELTDILFYIAKHRLVVVFEKILRHVLATEIGDNSEVDELDTEVRLTYEALPENLRPRPLSESVVDPPYLIVTRLCVYFMYQKSLCVLHRRHVARGRVQSIQTCYESSSDLVRCFLDAYAGFQPGGQNESEKWFMSSITWHDYLLGAMALCLVLCVSSRNWTGISIDSVSTIDLLHRSRSVCLEQSDRSKDTRRVAKLIHATILRFAPQYGHSQSPGSSGDVALLVNQSGSLAVPSSYSNPQSVGQGLDAPFGIQETSGFPAESMWAWDEDMARPVDDASWKYLEQFLNLSNDDLMADL